MGAAMTETVIRDSISRYLAGIISAEQLEHGLPDGVDLDEADDLSLRDLTLRVMGLLAENAVGDIDEFTLRQRLNPEASWRIERTFSFSGSLETATRPVETSVSQAGTPPKVVFA